MTLINKNAYKNLPWMRRIEKIDEHYPRVIPNIIKIISDIKIHCFENNISKRKQRKIIRQKLKEEFYSLPLSEIEKRVKLPDSKSEFIALNHNTILVIFKKKEDYISKENLFRIVSDLMKGISYVAQYGFDLILVDNKQYELIELDDFNFKFNSKEDLKHVINILQILDSEYYQIKKLEAFYSGKWIHRDSFFDELKEKKYLQIDESKYLYLDTKLFTEMDRLPEDYPDKTESILKDLSF